MVITAWAVIVNYLFIWYELLCTSAQKTYSVEGWWLTWYGLWVNYSNILFVCFILFVRSIKKFLKEIIYTHYKSSLVHARILHISHILHSSGWLVGLFGFVFWEPWILYFLKHFLLFIFLNRPHGNILCLRTQSNSKIQKRPLKIILKRRKVDLKSPNCLIRERVSI